MRVKRMVEKPHPKIAPSNFGIVGRYVVPAEIFALLEETPPGKGGEIQLTDALHMLARMNKVVGFKFDGKRVDTGNAMGLLHASMYQAYHRPEMREKLMELIQEFQSEDDIIFKCQLLKATKKVTKTRTCPKSSGTLVSMG